MRSYGVSLRLDFPYLKLEKMREKTQKERKVDTDSNGTLILSFTFAWGCLEKPMVRRLIAIASS